MKKIDIALIASTIIIGLCAIISALKFDDILCYALLTIFLICCIVILVYIHMLQKHLEQDYKEKLKWALRKNSRIG